MHTLLLSLLLLMQYTNTTGTVVLAWDANTETDLAGYRVYQRTTTDTYGAAIAVTGVSATPTHTVANLASGTYYFVVTAFDTSGWESGYSNEVSVVVTVGVSYDLNGDGSVNVADLQLLVNVILGTGTTSGADLNGDGSVNAVDLQLMINRILSGG